jgi:hypothetical protein
MTRFRIRVQGIGRVEASYRFPVAVTIIVNMEASNEEKSPTV